jgi:hypothetical protein
LKGPSRRILDIVHKHAASSSGGAYNQLLKYEAELLARSEDSYIFHEHLEEHCEPLYFHQFIDRARPHGLQYMSEPKLAAMAPLNFGADAHQQLQQLARTVVEMEQFMDFLGNRSFRQSLLRRAGTKLNLTLQWQLVESLHISGFGQLQNGSVDDPIAAADPPAMFRTLAGGSATTQSPIFKAAILELTKRYPGSMPYEELLLAACRRMGVEPTDEQRGELSRSLLLGMTLSDMLEASVEPVLFTIAPGDYPLARPYTRHQAKHSALLTNGRHEITRLKPVEQAFLQMLDGQRSRDDLARMANVPRDRIDEQIERFARQALLIPNPDK